MSFVTCKNPAHVQDPHELLPMCLNPTTVPVPASAASVVDSLDTIRKFRRATQNLRYLDQEVERSLSTLDDALAARRVAKAEVEVAHLAFVKLTGKEVTLAELDQAWTELEKRKLL